MSKEKKDPSTKLYSLMNQLHQGTSEVTMKTETDDEDVKY